MKIYSIIFLTSAIILAVIACILPNWSKNEIVGNLKFGNNFSAKLDMSRNDGLWLKCKKYTDSLNFKGVTPTDSSKILSESGLKNECKKYGTPGVPEQEGNLASKILSIVGPSLLLISTLFVGIGYNHSKLVGVVGIWCMLALVLVYPLLVLNHINNDEKTNRICKLPATMSNVVDVKCHTGTLSTSYFLEIGAIVLAIIGLVIHTGKSSKRIK